MAGSRIGFAGDAPEMLDACHEALTALEAVHAEIHHGRPCPTGSCDAETSLATLDSIVHRVGLR